MTQAMLREIITLNKVMPEFRDVVLSFCSKTCAVEEAFSGPVFRRFKSDTLGRGVPNIKNVRLHDE